MSLKGRLLALACFSTLLSGCVVTQPISPVCNSTSPCVNGVNSQTSSNLNFNSSAQSLEIIDIEPRDPIIINATGYSAPVTNKSLSKAQARLMSLRGSKLDAYRNLSERVYGISLDGSSSLSNMMAQHDDLRAYVNAYLVGAKVISQRELEDGSFETVVELALQENFRQCASSPEAIRLNPNCQVTKRASSTTSVPKKQPSTFYSVQ